MTQAVTSLRLSVSQTFFMSARLKISGMKGFRLLRSSFPFSREIARANERKKPRDLRGGKNSWKKKKRKKISSSLVCLLFFMQYNFGKIDKQSRVQIEKRKREREKNYHPLQFFCAIFYRNIMLRFENSLVPPRMITWMINERQTSGGLQFHPFEFV